MRPTALAVHAALSLAVWATAASAQHEEQPSMPSPPRPVKAGGTGPGSYYGIVTDLTKDSITVTYGKEKPVRFPVSDILASGGFAKVRRPIPGWQPQSVSPSFMFRLKEVKVGDWILIDYVAIDGVITCDHICIQKRPGGRMPPLPKEAEALWKEIAPRPYVPYHEQVDAYWDLEDKGIPYPEKFGHRRCWPVAPRPRAVSGAGPRISQ